MKYSKLFIFIINVPGGLEEMEEDVIGAESLEEAKEILFKSEMGLDDEEGPVIDLDYKSAQEFVEDVVSKIITIDLQTGQVRHEFGNPNGPYNYKISYTLK